MKKKVSGAEAFLGKDARTEGGRDRTELQRRRESYKSLRMKQEKQKKAPKLIGEHH